MGIAPYHRLDQWIVLASIKPRYAPTRRAIQSRSSGGMRGSAPWKSKLSILQLRTPVDPSNRGGSLTIMVERRLASLEGRVGNRKNVMAITATGREPI